MRHNYLKYSNPQKDRPVIYHYFSRTWQWTCHGRQLAVCQGRLPMFLVVVSFVSWARCPDDDIPTSHGQMCGFLSVFLLENSESFGLFQLVLKIGYPKLPRSRFWDIWGCRVLTSLTHSQFAWKLWISQLQSLVFPLSKGGQEWRFGRFGMAKDTKAWQSNWQLTQIRVIVYSLSSLIRNTIWGFPKNGGTPNMFFHFPLSTIY
jgi:hypothetical protein